MASRPNKATVRVRLTVSVAVSRAWEHFDLASLFEECSEEARRKVAKALEGTGVSIVGSPRTRAVLVSDEEDESR